MNLTENSPAGTPSTTAHATQSKYSAPAAACAANVLLHLARTSTAVSLADLARETRSSKSLTFRVMRELEAVGLAHNADGAGYRLGHAVLEFAPTIAQLGVPKDLGDILRELSNETEQTVNFGILRDFDVLITAKRQPAQAMVSVTYVGARIPANCAALGKILLSRLTPEQLDLVMPDSLPRLTSKSTTDHDELLAEIETLRGQPYAVDVEGAILGRFAIAVPVLSPTGSANAALAVTGSMDDYGPAHVGRLYRALSRAAAQISHVNPQILYP